MNQDDDIGDEDTGEEIVETITALTFPLPLIMRRVEQARELRHRWNVRWKEGGGLRLSAAELAEIIEGLGALQRQFATDDVALGRMLDSMVTSCRSGWKAGARLPSKASCLLP
jgi:hypothetical protein